MILTQLVLLSLVGFGRAFAPAPRHGVTSRLAATEEPKPEDPPSIVVEPPLVPEVIEGSKSYSGGQDKMSDVSMQIFERNPVLDTVKLAGDAGFDPFSFATDKQALLGYRSAEIRHARLAMLATVGWPISELVQPKVAELANLASGLSTRGLAPSILNGGLGDVPKPFWIVAIAAAALLELRSLDREKEGKMPGDLGFDPLGMNSVQMEEAEILNGRIAMFAITGFAIQEALYRLPVVDETPFFFHSIF